MAKYSNTVEYNIKTNLDSSGITKLQAELSQLQNHLHRWNSKGLIEEGAFTKTLADIKTVQNALQQAFNPKLGMLNTSAFMKNLKSQGLTIKGIYESFSAAGTKGTQAFTSMYGQISKLDTGLRSVSKTTDKIMNTVGNTMRWGLIASGFSQIMNAAHQAVEYTKELDTSLTNIMMVSGETRDNMNQFAKDANEVAQRLGATTTQMTEAAKVFVQQGMTLDQSSKMGEYAVHLANISEQDSATTSDELTAMKNAFKINIDDMGNAISKWAAIANNTAVDMEELSVASQKAASVAQTTGVSMEQFAGHIAAIEATTREAPENIGNGLKTLYSRFADIKLGKDLEDGVDLGRFASALQKVGVETLDASGKMRDVGVILEDTMKVWGQLDKTQQNALATTVAGRFQLGRFEALMNSQDIYQTALGAAQSETGTETYDKMQDIYAESLVGKGKTLQAKVEEIFNNLFTTDSFGGLIDGLSGMVDVINDLIEATGGGTTALTGLATILFSIAKESMARGISNFITNRQADIQGRKNLADQEQAAKATLLAGGLQTGAERTDQLSKNIAGVNQYATELNIEQREKVNQLINQSIELENGLAQAQKNRSDAEQQLRAAMAGTDSELSNVTEELIGEAEAIKQGTGDIEVYSEKYNKLINLVNNTATSMAKFTNALEKNEGHYSGEEIQRYVGYLEKLAQQEGLVAEKAETLNKAAATLKKFSQNGAEVSKMTEALNKAQVEMAELSETLASADPKLEKIIQDYFKATQAETEFAAGANFVSRQMQGMQEQFSLQHMLNNIGDATMAIGQLAFTWQSFKGLGAIFNNEDLISGEKLEQIILNLSMNIPMLIMGLNQLQTAFGLPGLKTAIDNLKNYKKASQELKIANEAVALTTEKQALAETRLNAIRAHPNANPGLITIRENALNAAKKASAAATKEQAAAETALAAARRGASLLSIGLLVGTAAIMAATAAWGAYQQSIENAKKAEMEHLDTAINAANETRQSIKPWEEISEEWRNTGEISEEAKQKAADLADTLEIAGGKALAAAGDFETLNAKIQKLGDDSATKAINAAKDLLQGQYGKSLNGEELFNGSAHSDYGAALNKGAGQQILEYSGPIDTSTVAGILRSHQTSGESVIEDIQQARAALEDLNAAKEKLDNNKANLDTDSYKRQAEDIRVATQALREFLSMEDVAAAEKAFETIFSNETQLSSFQEKLAAAGNDTLKMVEVFSNAPGEAGEYFRSMTDGAEQLRVMLAATTDEAQKLTLEMSLAATDAQENIVKLGMKNGMSVTEAGDKVRAVGDQISQMGLYQEDATALLTQISETDSLDEIQEGLDRVKESGDIADFKIPVKVEVDPEQAKQEVKNAIEELKQEDFDADVNLDAGKALTKAFSEDAGSFDGYSKELEGTVDEAKEAADELLRYDSALEKCQESMKDWNEQLSSDAIQDQIAAASELTDVYNDLLDVGEGLSVSTDFAKDADNLKLLEDAANGVEGAYEELQDAAAEDILIHLGVDKSEIPGIIDSVHSIQDQIGDLKIGASIDESLWPQLEKIVNEAGLTADQASDFLSMIGVDIDPTAFEEGVSQIPGVASEAATAAAENMSIDTEIETGSAEENTEDTYYNVTPNVSPYPFTAVLPAGQPGGAPQILSGAVPQVQYDVTPMPANKTQQVAGMSVKAKTNKGGGTGNLKIKKGASVRRGGSGGAKHANASHGGGAQGGGGSGGGGGGGCFAAGTLITLKGYTKNIEDIKVGDIVLSYNEKLKLNQYSKVLQTMIHDVHEKIYKLYVENSILTVTGIHKFYVYRKGFISWIPAEELKLHDLVMFADGSWHKIRKINSKIQKIKVYNFEVSGNHNYYVGYNQILAHNKGKGGGGKGKKAKEPKEVKRKETAKSEIDIYEKVNAKLEKISDQLKTIDRLKGRAYGASWRKAIKEETELLGKQINTNKDYIDIAKRKLEALRTGKSDGQIGLIFSKNEFDNLDELGLKTDKSGAITNYKDRYLEEYNKYQEEMSKADAFWKAHGGTLNKDGTVNKEAKMNEKDSKKYDKMVESANKYKEKADAITKVTQDYNKTLDEVRDKEEEIQEALDKIQDIVIEAYNKTRDAAQDLAEYKDDALEMNKNLADMWGNDTKRNLQFAQKSFENLFKTDASQLQSQLDNALAKVQTTSGAAKEYWEDQAKQLKEAQDNGTSVLELNNQRLEKLIEAKNQFEETGTSDLFGNNHAAMMEAFQDAWEDAVKLAEELKDRIDEIHDSIQDVMDEMYDGFDDMIDQFDTITDQYEHISSLTELVYGEKAYARQEEIARKQAVNGEERLKVLEQTRKTNHDMLETLKETVGIESEEYKEALEKERDIDKEILSTREDIAETYKKAKEYANELAVQNWLDNFEIQVENAMVPLDYGIDAWERIKENADLYLDDLNRAWELEKLQNRYTELLNNNTDPNLQRQITQQMEQQLGYLRDKTNLSEYDVKYANAQLEILQKTIALEDARAAKNSMKLRRDSQGNYNYVYTADQGKTGEAKNDLLDSQMNAYNMSVEEAAAAQDRYLNKIQNMADQLRQVANDDTLTKEQIAAITADIISQGYEFLNAQGEQLTEAQKNAVNSFIAAAQQLAEENAGAVTEISQNLIADSTANANMMTQLMSDTVQNWIGPDGLSLFRDEADLTRDDIIGNIGEFENAIGEVNKNIETPLDDIDNQFDKTNDAARGLLDTTKEFYTFLKDNSQVVTEAANNLKYYEDKLTTSNQAMAKYFNDAQTSMGTSVSANLTAETQGLSDAMALKKAAEWKSGLFTKGDKLQLKKGTTIYFGRGGKQKNNSGKTSWVTDRDYTVIVDNPNQMLKSDPTKLAKHHVGFHVIEDGWKFIPDTEEPNVGNRIHEQWHLSPSELASSIMKSGGYTGDWGPDEDTAGDPDKGKWAILHQKELVLNATDTENILKVVDIVRNLVAASKNLNLSSLGNNINGASQNNIEKTIEQRVDINAEFPNARDAMEIRKALIDLSDNAYQYAYTSNSTGMQSQIASIRGNYF